MGKFVLYGLAAVILGSLMVAIPMGIGLTGYVLMTNPGEVSAEAFVNASFTGFVLYLALVWAMQESFQDQFGLFPRIALFIISPITIVYFHAEWSLVTSMVALAIIAALAAYQMLVTVAERHRREAA